MTETKQQGRAGQMSCTNAHKADLGSQLSIFYTGSFAPRPNEFARTTRPNEFARTTRPNDPPNDPLERPARTTRPNDPPERVDPDDSPERPTRTS